MGAPTENRRASHVNTRRGKAAQLRDACYRIAMDRRRALACLGALSTWSTTLHAAPRTPKPKPARGRRGIYLRQDTVEDGKQLYPFIQSALEAKVDTFVTDLWTPGSRYKKNVERFQSFGLRYVPRITVFPDGGKPEQVHSKKYWETRWKLVDYALELGAREIQLDYIRYNSRNPPSPRNAINVHTVIRFFKERVAQRGAKLQIDIFGEVSHKPSLHIGQDISLFAPDIDAVCPMVYPSHYKPYSESGKRPYETVHGSLVALADQLGNHPVDVYAYIELSNHHVPMSVGERVSYVRAELQAVRDSGASGWFAWSALNRYDLLFEILRRFGDGASGDGRSGDGAAR